MSEYQSILDQLVYEHETEHFRFRYCYRSAPAALRDPKTRWPPVVSIHGVHDFAYVRLLHDFFERAWEYFIGMKFDRPYGYSEGNKYPVNIYDLPDRLDGITRIAPKKNNSVVEVRNQYPDSASPCNMQRMQAAVVHELAHAIQYSYRTVGSRNPWHWWSEAVATFVEGEVFPGNMEYTLHLHEWLNKPHNPLDTTDSCHEYGSVLFCRFLAENYGRDIIHQIWSLAEQAESPFDALDFILRRDHGVPFASSESPDALALFMLTNYFLTSDAYHYQYGGIYKERFQHVLIEHYCDTYPFWAGNRLDHLAARYYVFTPAGDSITLRIKLQAYPLLGESSPVKGVVASYSNGKVAKLEEIYLESENADGSSSGETIVRNFRYRRYDEILLVVINCSWGNKERNLVRYDLTVNAD